MCGIGAIYKIKPSKIGDIELKDSEKISGLLKNRGPDSNGIWFDSRISIVHRRLAIVDTNKRSTQPMESKTWVICLNGEIINYKELKKTLKEKIQFKTSSDTEVLLQAIEFFGLKETLNKIAGMFAFLAYNKKTQTLYAVRDHLGIKPLFYSACQNNSVYFASSASAIQKANKNHFGKINNKALSSFFQLGATFTAESCFENIKRLGPAEILSISPNGSQSITKYWEPKYDPSFSVDDLMTIIQEYKYSDVKSAIFLSGGIDSSFLVSTIGDLDCFHLDSPEKKFAEAVAIKYKRKIQIVKPTASDYFESLRECTQSFGEPLMSAGIPGVVSAAIKRTGYKMAISANGADELFYGYPRTPIIGLKEPNLYPEDGVQNNFFSYQYNHIFRHSEHYKIKSIDYKKSSKHGFELSKQFYMQNFPAHASYRWFELMTYVLHDLNATLDAASMHYGIEVRVPFLDHRIVQGVLSWEPEKIVTSQFGRKSPLKQVLSKDFGPSFLSRPKQGFSINDGMYQKIEKRENEILSKYIKNGFIEIKSKITDLYERDINYLKKSVLAFHLWGLDE